MSETRPLTILYVEDDPDYREAVRAILESAGFRVVEASSAEDGLALFRQENPQAVILDLMMEEVDAGVTLTKEIRAAGSVGDALTYERATDELGVTAVLQKPIRGETLLGLLRARLP